MSKRHITKGDVEHISQLAHIELTEEEKEVFVEQFNRILEFFEKIDEVNTEGIPPTYHVLDLANIFREDEIQESLPREEALRNAPRREDGFFKSPRIV
ncbi:MAG: Asp-tRNA(Asn)/Glu-tRNA(Gln) amidotransferase subunit GatC [Candidatus Bathyarchaeia archaeon]